MYSISTYMYILKINQMKVNIPVSRFLWEFGCFFVFPFFFLCFCWLMMTRWRCLGCLQPGILRHFKQRMLLERWVACWALMMCGWEERCGPGAKNWDSLRRTLENGVWWVGWYIVRFLVADQHQFVDECCTMMWRFFGILLKVFFDEVVLMVSKHVGWSPLF